MSATKVTYVKGNFIPIFRAFCLPYFGIFINEKWRGDKLLIKHEQVHLDQMKRMTLPVYLIRYIVQLIFIGYDSMPMELEARQHDPDGIWNYRQRHWYPKKKGGENES